LRRMSSCCRTPRRGHTVWRHGIEREGIRQAAPLIDSGTIRKDRLSITLHAAALSNALELQVDELTPPLLRLKAPFHCRRRGAEMKIIAGSFQPVPDKTMIRALRNAHAWVRQMKAGASIRES
jgi:site-specific DNA recombinase